MQFFDVGEARVWAFERAVSYATLYGLSPDDILAEAEKLALWAVNGPSPASEPNKG